MKMKNYSLLSGLKECRKGILTLLFVAFGSASLYAQHLFSVDYGGLSREDARLMRTEATRTAVPTTSLPRNRNNKEVYAFSLSSEKNKKIVLLNEETERSVVIVPTDEAPAQFELSPFFIEELRRAALGYLVVPMFRSEIFCDFFQKKCFSKKYVSLCCNLFCRSNQKNL